MKNTINEMKSTLGFNRFDEADRISELEDKVAKYTQAEQQKEKRIVKN